MQENLQSWKRSQSHRLRGMVLARMKQWSVKIKSLLDTNFSFLKEDFFWLGYFSTAYINQHSKDFFDIFYRNIWLWNFTVWHLVFCQRVIFHWKVLFGRYLIVDMLPNTPLSEWFNSQAKKTNKQKHWRKSQRSYYVNTKYRKLEILLQNEPWKEILLCKQHTSKLPCLLVIIFTSVID